MVRVKYILKFFGHVISLERVNLYKLENRSAFCKDREEGRRGKGKGRQKRRRGKETVYLVMLKPPKRKFIILILCISVPSPCPCHDQIWLRDPRYFVAKINLDWHNVVLTGRKTAEKTAILTKFWNLVVLLRIYLLSPIRAKFGHPRYAITMPIFIPIGFLCRSWGAVEKQIWPYFQFQHLAAWYRQRWTWIHNYRLSPIQRY